MCAFDWHICCFILVNLIDFHLVSGSRIEHFECEYLVNGNRWETAMLIMVIQYHVFYALLISRNVLHYKSTRTDELANIVRLVVSNVVLP